MDTRRLALLAASCALGGAVVLMPSLADGEAPPTVDAATGNLPYTYAWSPSSVKIAPGGAVTLRNSSTAVAHGVRWVGGPGAPTCEKSVPVGSTASASGTAWSGACTFAAAGTYDFYCTVHGAGMAGTVVVEATSTTPATTPSSTPPGAITSTATTPAATPPPGAGAGAGGAQGPADATPPPGGGAGGAQGAASATPSSPLAGSSPLRLRPAYRGRAVSGVIDVSAAGAHGRLEVQLLIARASLEGGAGGRGSGRLARVGRYVRADVPAGAFAFTVRLDARGLRALRRHRRLTVTAAVALTPPAGSAARVSRRLTLRP